MKWRHFVTYLSNDPRNRIWRVCYILHSADFCESYHDNVQKCGEWRMILSYW